MIEEKLCQNELQRRCKPGDKVSKYGYVSSTYFSVMRNACILYSSVVKYDEDGVIEVKSDAEVEFKDEILMILGLEMR